MPIRVLRVNLAFYNRPTYGGFRILAALIWRMERACRAKWRWVPLDGQVTVSSGRLDLHKPADSSKVRHIDLCSILRSIGGDVPLFTVETEVALSLERLCTRCVFVCANLERLHKWCC